MAIKDSIVNLKKGLRTTLTNVPALIDTLIRGLDGVAEAAEEENTYSANERLVGTWTDGKPLYELTYEYGALPNNEILGKNLPEGLSIGEIISIIGTSTNGSDTIPLPFKWRLGDVGIYATATQVYINTTTDRSDFTRTTVILRYTKASASKSPEENDTKNGDEEKNDEEVKTEK